MILTNYCLNNNQRVLLILAVTCCAEYAIQFFFVVLFAHIENITVCRQYGQLTLGIRESGVVLIAVVQWPHSDHSPDGQIIEFDVSDFELSGGFRHHIKAILNDRTLDLQVGHSLFDQILRVIFNI
jgi:hypothetical protein